MKPSYVNLCGCNAVMEREERPLKKSHFRLFVGHTRASVTLLYKSGFYLKHQSTLFIIKRHTFIVLLSQLSLNFKFRNIYRKGTFTIKHTSIRT